MLLLCHHLVQRLLELLPVYHAANPFEYGEIAYEVNLAIKEKVGIVAFGTVCQLRHLGHRRDIPQTESLWRL
jgi:hypothetical protein